jgi:hypothetical protein
MLFTAEDSFAAIFARRRFGIAIAAMMRMIATTIRSSIRENPFASRRLAVRLAEFGSVEFIGISLLS